MFDIWKYQIPNTVSIVAILDFFLSALFLPVQTHWISHLGAAVSVLVGGLILYRFRLLGAGDVKLMTAFSLWAGFESLPTFLLFMALAGGALSLVLVCLRYLVSVAQFQNLLPVMPQSIPRLLKMGESIPYGVAIAVGGAALMSRVPALSASRILFW